MPLTHEREREREAFFLFAKERISFLNLLKARAHRLFWQRLQCLRGPESLGSFSETRPAQAWTCVPRSPREERGVCGGSPGSFTDFSANKQEIAHSVLPRGDWYFRSKALVSSGNRIARRMGALSLVFPAPSEGQQGGVKSRARAPWKKVRLGGLG